MSDVNLKKRHFRLRKKVVGTPERPRLIAKKSNLHTVAFIVDDTQGKTLVHSSTISLKIKGNKTESAKQVGKDIAVKAKEAGISKVVFDRGGHKYHGRIMALADAAREEGLEF